MISINAPIFDLEGSLVIEHPAVAGLSAFTRRVSRVATLDGGAVINDFGYSPADRTLDVEWATRNQAEIDQARRLVQLYGRLIVSFSDGCFLVAPQDFATTEDGARLTLLVERQLN